MADAAERKAPKDDQIICNAFVEREQEIAKALVMDEKLAWQD